MCIIQFATHPPVPLPLQERNYELQSVNEFNCSHFFQSRAPYTFNELYIYIETGRTEHMSLYIIYYTHRTNSM